MDRKYGSTDVKNETRKVKRPGWLIEWLQFIKKKEKYKQPFESNQFVDTSGRVGSFIDLQHKVSCGVFL